MSARVVVLLLALVLPGAQAADCFPSEDQCLGKLSKDQSYGSSPRQVLDLYVPVEGQGRPVVVFIHGGAFANGDKSELWPGLTRALLRGGYAVASANYRLVPEVRYPEPMQDVGQAIRYLAANGASLGVDGKRLVLSGSSAGGGIALWIGLRNELASGVAGIVGINAQTTYDPADIARQFGVSRFPAFIARFLGVSQKDLLSADPGLRARFKDASPVNYLDASDPPVVLIYTTLAEPLPADARPMDYVHHVGMGELLASRAKSLNADVRIRANSAEKPGSEAFNRAFLQDVDGMLAKARQGGKRPQ
jgi:acetyl esterase/lipase